MVARASAFAALGLEPGADGAAVERAYKRLMKEHHPDREGGDASRAAEITRAYRELRGGKAAADPLQFNDFVERRRRPRWPLAALAGGGILALLLLTVGSSVPLSGALWANKARLASHLRPVSVAPHDPIGDPLHLQPIDQSVRQALALFRKQDEMALANASNACQRRFRDDPGTRMLDRCAAFDDAVVGLEDRDPLRDNGPFAPLAVTARQWSSASALSDNDLAIDERLDQIRLRVEIALAPQIPPVAPAIANSG